VRRCRSRDCFLNPPFSKPVQILENSILRVNRKMPIPMNFFNIHPPSSNHVGTVCYTRKTAFPRGGNCGPRQARAARALARRGFPRTRARRIAKGTWRGFHRKGGLIPTMSAPICFLHRRYFSRRHRVWSVFPPEPADLPDTLIGRTGENFIVCIRFPAPDTSRRGTFAAYGTAGKSRYEVEALSGDIPGASPGSREGVSPAHH
jgi:hypothetical protein